MIPILGVPLLEAIILIGMIASMAFYAMSIFAIGRFTRSVRNTRIAAGATLPPVTILKPLKGADAFLYSNLESLCLQDYPTFQILCGVSNAGDPAVAVVERLKAAYPAVDMTLVVDGHVYGANYKVSNLHNMMGRAKHDTIVLADSDILVERDHLARLVPPLNDTSVGLVTCLYRAISAGGWPARFESLFINADFCSMILVARLIEKPSYAFGATIALRRSVLDEIGGFLALSNFLADDYQIGHRVAALGYELVLNEQVVDTIITVDRWRSLLQHQLRWARTYKICRPGGYFSSVLTHGTSWTVAYLVFTALSPLHLALAAVTLGLRFVAASCASRSFLRVPFHPSDIFLLPAKDLFTTFIWALAFLGDTVWWSGRRFRVSRSGEMADLTPGAPQPAERWLPDSILAEHETAPPPT